MEPAAEHSPESYRMLFGLLGAAMMVMVAVFIAASVLIAPLWAVLALGVAWAGGAVLSVASWPERPWVPLAAGTVVAVLWIGLITAGTAALGWRT